MVIPGVPPGRRIKSWKVWEQRDRERAEKERERAEKERERALRLQLENELARLRARLGPVGGGRRRDRA